MPLAVKDCPPARASCRDSVTSSGKSTCDAVGGKMREITAVKKARNQIFVRVAGSWQQFLSLMRFVSVYIYMSIL